MSSLISSVAWVKRGIAAQHPTKYTLDEKELQRVSALARIEIEDARVELERAHEAAKQIGRGDDEDEDVDGDQGDEDAWIDEEDGDVDMDDASGKNKTKSKDKVEDEDELAKYNLEDYDKESSSIATGPFSNIKGLTYYRNNEEDPYITLKEDDEEMERQELEVLPTDNALVTAKTEDEISLIEIYVYDEIQENLFVHHDIMLPAFPLCLEWLDFPPCAPSSSTSTSSSLSNSTSKGHSNNVSKKHNDDEDMAVDSDLDAHQSRSRTKQFGNYIAVGTFEPEIEIWSLDTIDALYPDTVLGRTPSTSTSTSSNVHTPTPVKTGKKKRKKDRERKKAPNDAYHTDAVLSLSWNRAHRNLLASASADKTVKLWDLSRDPLGSSNSTSATENGGGGAIRSFDIHKDKVQSVQWNEKEPTILLTGSYDRTVRTFDSRSPGTGVGAIVGADVEAVKWDPWDSTGFYVSLENGIVLNFDARTLPSFSSSSSHNSIDKPAQPRFMLAAHDGAASALDVNPHIRGCIVTGGTDKIVKVWNVNDKLAGGGGQAGKKEVSLVTSRDLGVGKVFSTSFSPDDPLTLAAAGSKAKLQIWDIGANSGVRKTFSQKLKEAGYDKELRKGREGGSGSGVVGVVSDDEDDSGDDNE